MVSNLSHEKETSETTIIPVLGLVRFLVFVLAQVIIDVRSEGKSGEDGEEKGERFLVKTLYLASNHSDGRETLETRLAPIIVPTPVLVLVLVLIHVIVDVWSERRREEEGVEKRERECGSSLSVRCPTIVTREIL